jgi:hypothetical protein
MTTKIRATISGIVAVIIVVIVYLVVWRGMSDSSKPPGVTAPSSVDNAYTEAEVLYLDYITGDAQHAKATYG